MRLREPKAFNTLAAFVGLLLCIAGVWSVLRGAVWCGAIDLGCVLIIYYTILRRSL